MEVKFDDQGFTWGLVGMSQSNSSGSQFLNDDLSPEFTSTLNINCKQQHLPKLPDIADSIIKLWKLKAYGKLLTHRTFTEHYIGQQLKIQWNFSNFTFCIVKTGLFLFEFQSKQELDFVLHNGPWIIGGHVMSFKAWEKEKPPEKMNFFLMPFWIQLFKMPLERFTAENGKQLGSSIGEVISVDPQQHFDTDGAYMRVRVILQANKPLPLFAEAQDQDFHLLSFPIKLERLEAFCYECGRLGHEKNACSAKETISWAKNLTSKRRYTSWLKGGVAKKTQQDTPATTRRLPNKPSQRDAADHSMDALLPNGNDSLPIKENQNLSASQNHLSTEMEKGHSIVISPRDAAAYPLNEHLPSGTASLIIKETQNTAVLQNQLSHEKGNSSVSSSQASKEHLVAVLSHAAPKFDSLKVADPQQVANLPHGEQEENHNLEVYSLAHQIDAMQTDEVTEESIIAPAKSQPLSCHANGTQKGKKPLISSPHNVNNQVFQTNTMHINHYQFLNLNFSKAHFSLNFPTDKNPDHYFTPSQASSSSQVQPFDVPHSKPLKFFKRRHRTMSSASTSSTTTSISSLTSASTPPTRFLTSRKHPRDGKDYKTVLKYSPPLKKRRLFLTPEDAVRSKVVRDFPWSVLASDSSESDVDEPSYGNADDACKELATPSNLELQLPTNHQEASPSQQDQPKRQSCKQ